VARQGRVSITPLDKPNALLLIGRRDSVDAVLSLVRKLDLPVPAHTQFQVFQLRHMSATDAETLINNFFAERVGPLAIQVRVATDFRTNAVIVHASARDLAEVERLLISVDRDDNAVQMEIRLFPLTNTMATDLAPILQQAITGQGGVGIQGAQGQPPQPQPGGAAGTGAQRNAPLSDDDHRQRRQSSVRNSPAC
jgi:general secretion pathway protein D